MQKKVRICSSCNSEMKVIEENYTHPIYQITRIAHICECPKCGETIMTDEQERRLDTGMIKEALAVIYEHLKLGKFKE